ncbi:MAG TPA: HAMP domain-containing sensor histidine kinase [Candidatus Eisenbacteria bacterium]|nr:HAMP domain-containing sensor histidine kinase [Candidatus Eisenbacteria bacterium]
MKRQMNKNNPRPDSGKKSLPNKFSAIHNLLIQEANAIQQLATQQHKHFLGGKRFRNELLNKYKQNHIAIVVELANNLAVGDIKRGTNLFKVLGSKLAKESLHDGLTLEEAVDGTIFLKQAIWQKLREKGLLDTLDVEDFYQFSFAIGTYCDVLVSKIAFAYHENYIQTLKKQAQHKDEFMSVATHELKTPVTSLKAFAQVMQSRLARAGDEKSALQLSKMDAQLNKLTALIGDLLDATKIDTGKLEFHQGYFDFNELVNEIVEEMQLTTERHRIIKKLSATKTIYGDRTRLGQVMVNLLSNAIKYSPHGDTILVSTMGDKKYITCCVQDYGIGIAKENHSKIFERFQRVGNQDTFGGLGLGLFIASRIIQRHGGTMQVESEKNKGSTFCFTLPVMKRNLKQQKNTLVKEEIKHD